MYQTAGCRPSFARNGRQIRYVSYRLLSAYGAWIDAKWAATYPPVPSSTPKTGLNPGRTFGVL